MRFTYAAALVLLWAQAFPASPAGANSEASHSSYAGQEARTIKSLSAEDIAELRRGGGWGLAKAAELNGVPGPKHLLDHKDAIPLTDEQVAFLERLYSRMKEAAIAEGARLIDLERQLNQAFVERRMSEERLKDALRNIERSRARLRLIHLSTHLEAAGILSIEQIKRYNRLRGYLDSSCATLAKDQASSTGQKHDHCT